MEWIQRNPKKAVGLSALAVLCVVILVWGMSGGGSSSPSAEPTLGGPSLAVPTATPSKKLTALPSPGSPTSVGSFQDFPTAGMGNLAPGLLGSGGSNGLPPHRVVIAAGSDGPLLGVGWRIPTGDGARKGKDFSYRKTFRHSTTAYGRPDYAQLYTRVGPDSSYLWCTVSVDGKVVEREEAKGPWGGVFCQG
jgi:hypothetical protein